MNTVRGARTGIAVLLASVASLSCLATSLALIVAPRAEACTSNYIPWDTGYGCPSECESDASEYCATNPDPTEGCEFLLERSCVGKPSFNRAFQLDDCSRFAVSKTGSC